MKLESGLRKSTGVLPNGPIYCNFGPNKTCPSLGWDLDIWKCESRKASGPILDAK